MTTIYLNANQLKVSLVNVRKSGPGDVTELAASIAAHGLIHPLVVLELPEASGKVTHEIVAGSRRWTAIKKAIKDKALPKDYAIECKVADNPQHARELSTAENVVRENMLGSVLELSC
jgi:ParB family chromosome partitioning protein